MKPEIKVKEHTKIKIKVCAECGADLYTDMCSGCRNVGNFRYIYKNT